MPIEIIAQRGAGDRQAPDIVDPLISDVRAALARGRAELDQGEGLQAVRLTTLFRAGVSKGNLVEIHDAFAGRSWKGVITGIEHTAQGGELLTNLEIKRV